MAKKRKNKKLEIIITIVTIIVCIIAKIVFNYDILEVLAEDQNTVSNTEIDQNNINIINPIENSEIQLNSDLKIYFIDVGQADSILIQNNNQNMLIDGGNNSDGKLLVKYFQELGIEKFDYIIGTHPHEDHIGGLDNIINSFEIEKIYMPDVSTNTATFEDVLDAVAKKDNLFIETPNLNDEFKFGECKFNVVSIEKNEEDLNQSSIVLKMQFGKNSFLFTGDATTENEKKMLNYDISVDVLKVAHHGSEYSTSDDFLNKVNPKYAIISVGKDNKYGHPSKSVLKKFKNKNIEIHRTDKEGTILLTSDGENIEIQSFKTNTNGGEK